MIGAVSPWRPSTAPAPVVARTCRLRAWMDGNHSLFGESVPPVLTQGASQSPQTRRAPTADSGTDQHPRSVERDRSPGAPTAIIGEASPTATPPILSHPVAIQKQSRIPRTPSVITHKPAITTHRRRSRSEKWRYGPQATPQGSVSGHLRSQLRITSAAHRIAGTLTALLHPGQLNTMPETTSSSRRR
jgi:hypothetical protein